MNNLKTGSLKLLLKYLSLQVNYCITGKMNSFPFLFTFLTNPALRTHTEKYGKKGRMCFGHLPVNIEKLQWLFSPRRTVLFTEV